MKKVDELLINLIKINSFSLNEKRICDYTYKVLKKENFKVKKDLVDKYGYNIVAKIGKPKVFLATHMDTVESTLLINETKKLIYGRGVCDAKGSLASMICAAIECKNEGLKDFGLIFTVGEEKDFRGAKKLLKSNVKVPFIVVGEPTSLEVVNKHYGALGLKISAKGKKAHSSQPKEGINAIDKLIKAVIKIKRVKLNKGTILSIVKINGGAAVNIIPDKADVSIDIRVSPDDKTDYYQKIKKVLGSLAKVEKCIAVDGISTKPSKELSFIKKINTMKGLTELSFYKKMSGYKGGVVLGPGNIKYAHSSNEQISKKELEKAVEIYKKIIINYNK